ncbi:MAG: choice-of-anchor D domain-containing protein [Archangium sp.]
MRILSLAALATVVLAGCNCDNNVNKRFGKIEVLDDEGNARNTVEFGQVQLTFSATKSVRVRNAGTGSLDISAATFSNAKFATTGVPVSLAPSDEVMLAFTFKPDVADQRETGTVTLTTNDPDRGSVQLSLAGTGVTATAIPNPRSFDFGEVYANEFKTLTFTLTNSGSNELPVTGAKFTGTDPSLTADLTPLVKTLAGGESAMVTLRFAPTTAVTLGGTLDIELPAGVGSLSLPITGKGIVARPKLCFRFEGSPMEQCTDGTPAMTLNVSFGSLCDSRVYPADGGLVCSSDGGVIPYERAGRFYVRNEGNTPVSYSMSINAGTTSRCDGGSSIDFLYANAPAASDGGVLPTFMVPTSKLPNAVTDPMPWETAPVSVVYRARSACRGGDDSDLSPIIWTRQGEPIGTSRTPSTMLATLSGTSVLANPEPFPITFTGNRPVPIEARLVSNVGDGPVELLSVSLRQSFDGGSVPDQDCAGVDAGPCIYFSWVDGPTLPTLLEGTTVINQPVDKVLGRIAYGIWTVDPITDAGMYIPPSQVQKVWAVVNTSDPYEPVVNVPITGRSQ